MDKLHLTTLLTEGVLLCNVKVWENCVNLANSIFLFFKHFNECLGIITTQIIEQSRNIETNNINSRYRFLNFTAHTIIILLYRSTKINQIDLEIIWVNSTISIYDCYIDTDIRKNIAALKANIHCLLESKSPSLLPKERERLTIFFFKILFTFRERRREGEKERKKHGCVRCVRDTLIGCLSQPPSWGPGPQPRHVLWPGIEPVTFWFADQHSIHWARTARTEKADY